MIEAIARPQYLTRDQVHRLIDAAKPGRDRLFIRVAWETGARVGELVALTFGSVSAKFDCIHFNGREVPISASLAAELKGIFAREELREGHPVSEELRRVMSKLLFDFNRGTAYRIVRDAGRRAGLVLGDDSRDITPEAFPHSFAMHCVLEGVPLEIVQQVMGITPAQAAKYGAGAAADPARVREFLRKVTF
jgi:integrase